ncbi:GNAT family N-acetyltransferase [Candidatus Saccharibacteria bacterium]|nr:GNAT family N-acetyltransferase [Candidatus Saccharibacteria bacterium]
MTEGLTNTPNFELSDTRDIDVVEIQKLRESVEWLPDTPEVWQRTLETALAVSSVYSEDELVGIGFLVGSPRHAVLCDLCVNPANQAQGIGTKLVESLVDAANNQGIRYVTLTMNEKNADWLEGLYSKNGFQMIGNAMQLVRDENSVPAAMPNPHGT